MALPANLATNDIIDEVWTDAVVNELTALPSRYAPLVRTVGYATVAVNQAVVGGNVLTDITGLTATWVAVAGRRYKISLHVPDVFMATAGNQQFYISTGAGVWVALQNYAGLPANSNHPADLWAVQSPAAGSVTYKAMCAMQNAATIVQNVAGCPGAFLVEDIG